MPRRFALSAARQNADVRAQPSGADAIVHEQLSLWATVIWQGFSLALVIGVLARAAVATEQGRRLRVRISMPHRLLVAGFCVVGLFAAAATAGGPARMSGVATFAMLLGVAGGVWGALRLMTKEE